MVFKHDYDDVPVIKVVFWGPSMAGKTTALTIYKVLKSLEDPKQVYKFLKVEDPTGRTLFFDQAIFGLGTNPQTRKSRYKYHIFTVPGQERHSGQRKVILQGAHGLVIVIDASKNQYEYNKESIAELNILFKDKFVNGGISFVFCLNKMDLPKEERISVADLGKLLVETGWSSNLRDSLSRVVETSCLNARDDLTKILQEKNLDELKDEKGYLKRDLRPESVQRIVKPIEMVLREILVKKLQEVGN